MKKINALLILVILIASVSFLNAATARVYMQKVVLDTGAMPGNPTDNNPIAGYKLTADVVETTGEVLSTDINVSTTITVKRTGNGTSVPYYVVAYLNLAGFSTQWVAGQTIHFVCTHIPTGASVSWDYVIASGTNAILINSPTITVPPSSSSPNPALATTPVPADGATDVAKNIHQISWTYTHDAAYADPTGYKVYFGTASDPAYVGYTTNTHYTLPALAYGTTYYWKVVPTTAAGTKNVGRAVSNVTVKAMNKQVMSLRGDATGASVWSFTTKAVANNDNVVGTGNGNGTNPIVVVPEPIIIQLPNGGGPVVYEPGLTINPAAPTADAFNVSFNRVYVPAPLWNPGNFRCYMNVATSYAGNGDLVISIPEYWDGTGYYEVVKYVGLNSGFNNRGYEWVAHYGVGVTWPSNLFESDPRFPRMGTWDFVNHTVTVAGYGFNGGRANNEFVINDGLDTVLPVTLASFATSVTSANFVQLNWTTESEINMTGYNVLRSLSNNQAEAAKVNVNMVESNNAASNYSFVDNNVAPATTYYYWLEAVDMGGTVSVYGPRTVTTNTTVTPPALPTNSAIKGVYPNPFRAGNGTTIEIDVRKDEVAHVTIYNILGQVVKTYTETAGTHQLRWDGKTAGSGIYFVKMSTPSNNSVKKLVVVN